ncbi:hypothetical protein [Frigoribacterium sp. CFBP9030]|uniref:hypothetical protein n=1 Tax=Frigoribacterium sp. CFBP9030 TaxID=3096537 RepID=UPI002A6A946A|nr:hypothetical protein [Frigoribacterium sp. CFBP9030]
MKCRKYTAAQPKKDDTSDRDSPTIHKDAVFKLVDKPDDFSAQVSEYLLQSKDDRTRILHELRVRVQENDAKNKSSFRSAAIVVLSVFIALAGVIIFPFVNAVRWDDTSPANVARLETAMNDDFAALQACSLQIATSHDRRALIVIEFGCSKAVALCCDILPRGRDAGVPMSIGRL